MGFVGSNPRGLWVGIPSGAWTFSEFQIAAKNESCSSLTYGVISMSPLFKLR